MRAAILIVGAGLFLFAGCNDGSEEADTASQASFVTGTASPAAPAASPARPRFTPGPNETLWRWGNVTVIVPNDSGITVGPDFAAQGLDEIVPLRIEKLHQQYSLVSSLVLIDAVTGDVVERDILAEHEAALNHVLATAAVNQFDAKTAGWPYREEPTPGLERRSDFPVSYLEPSPDSGLYVGFGLADPGGPFIDIRNGRSVAFVRIPPDGALEFDTAQVAKAELPVFERWLAEVKRCVEIEC